MTTQNRHDSQVVSFDIPATPDAESTTSCGSSKQVVVEKSASRLIKPATGTIFSSWTVMSKTMIGTGMLGLAYATASCGWILGLALLFGSGIFAMFTLHLLNILSCSLGTRHVSYYAVAEKVAPKARWIVDFAIAVKCLGVGISYLQVTAQSVVKLVDIWSNHGDHIDEYVLRLIIVLGVAVLLAPVCFRKRLSRTAFPNALGLVSLAYVAVLGIVYSHPGEGETRLGPVNAMAVLSKLPVFIFTFTCHQNMFLVAEDMKVRTQKRLDIIAVSSELTALVLFLPVLIIPYSTFGSDVASNYMVNLDDKAVPVQIGLLLLAVAESCAFPLQLYPCRKSVMVLISRGKSISVATERKLRRILTVFILIVAVAISVTVKSLGATFSFVGIIGSNTICFIMPTFLYVCWFRKEKGTKWLTCVVLCVLSVILVPVCLSALIYELSTGGNGN